MNVREVVPTTAIKMLTVLTVMEASLASVPMAIVVMECSTVLVSIG